MAKAAETDSLDEFLSNISEDGTHLCTVDTITSSVSKKDGTNWIIIKFTVTDDTSAIDGEDLQEFFKDFSHITLADYNEMAAKDKREVRDAKQRLRARLISLGVPENQLNGFKDYDSLMGKQAHVTVETSIGNGGRKFVNIRDVALAEE